MRDDVFLKKRLDAIWELLFPEIERKNRIFVRFKGTWKNKFGHIKKLRSGDSEIAVNGYFRNEKIPEYILDITLAHELVHYMHGFNSPLPKLYKHPHAGGVVNRELKRRGFGNVLVLEKKWIENEWKNIIKNEFKPRRNSFFRWF